MKTKGAIYRWMAVAMLLGGCGHDAPPTGTEAVNPHAVTQPVETTQRRPATHPVSPPLSPAEATKIVRAEIYRAKPRMNPSAQFPLKELTTTDIWDQLHAQVFCVTEGVQVNQAYIIHDQQCYPLGQSFGGHGLMSLCVADLGGDGQPKLIFSYSFGSGRHRSFVGVWRGGASWIDAKPILFDGDLLVDKVEDGHIRVRHGDFDSASRKFNLKGEFGTLHFAAEDKDPQAEITLNPSLPPEVLKRVSK